MTTAADNLRALGVTVIAVGIGGYQQSVLEAIASESGGKKLIFTGDEFSQIETLLVDALSDAGMFPDASAMTLYTLSLVVRCPDVVVKRWIFQGFTRDTKQPGRDFEPAQADEASSDSCWIRPS